MSNAHIVQLPKAFSGMKAVHALFSAGVIGLSAYNETPYEGPKPIIAISTGSYTLIITTYYFIALYLAKASYNWVALLVLECLAPLMWLLVAVGLAVEYIYEIGNVYSNRSCAASHESLQNGSKSSIWSSVFEAAVLIAIEQFILCCIILGTLSTGIHGHRMARKPITGGGGYSSNTSVSGKHSTSAKQPTQAHHAEPASEYPPSQHFQCQLPTCSHCGVRGPHAYEICDYNRC